MGRCDDGSDLPAWAHFRCPRSDSFSSLYFLNASGSCLTVVHSYSRSKQLRVSPVSVRRSIDVNVNLLWFRRDLRLDDNEAVAVATQEKVPVLPFFILDPWFYTNTQTCAHRNKFLFESLADLDRALRQHGSQLYLFQGDSVEVFQQLASSLQAQNLWPRLLLNWDVQTEYGLQRDRQITQFCQDRQISCWRGRNNFVQLQRDRRDRWRDEYYTYLREAVHVAPVSFESLSTSISCLPQLSIDALWQQYKPHWHGGSQHCIGGATQARVTLDSFLATRCQGYHWKLSQPWQAQHGGSSHLSAHIKFDV